MLRVSARRSDLHTHRGQGLITANSPPSLFPSPRSPTTCNKRQTPPIPTSHAHRRRAALVPAELKRVAVAAAKNANHLAARRERPNGSGPTGAARREQQPKKRRAAWGEARRRGEQRRGAALCTAVLPATASVCGSCGVDSGSGVDSAFLSHRVHATGGEEGAVVGLVGAHAARHAQLVGSAALRRRVAGRARVPE